MRRLKVTPYILTAAILLSFSGCQSSNEKLPGQISENSAHDKNKIVIGVTLQDLSNEFITMLNDSLLKKSKEYQNIELIIDDAEAKPDKQVAQMEGFITQRVDAIILNPADANALIPTVESALKARIPVITLSSDISKNVGQIWSGSDNYSAGVLEAEYIAKKLKGKGNIAIIRGPMGHLAEIERYKGYRSILDKYPNIKIVYDQSANWQREQAMALMEDWLQMDVPIDAVLSQNDAMMLGALEAIEELKEQGEKVEMVTAGIDAIEEALDAIKAGRMDATCFQDSRGQAFASIEMAIKAAKGEKTQDTVIPFELVTRENVDGYYDRLG